MQHLDGEKILENYLRNRIEENIISFEEFSLKDKAIFELSYHALRVFLQRIFLSRSNDDSENFVSLIFYLIQKRRESLENLYYLSNIFIRIKSPAVLWFLIYSNYNEWKMHKSLKPLYPLKRDYGLSECWTFIFPKYDLSYVDLKYFNEINEFALLYFSKVQPYYSALDYNDLLKYYLKSIYFNKKNDEEYVDTLRTGYKVYSRGFDSVYWTISILKNLSLIIETIEFSISKIDNYSSSNKLRKVPNENNGELFSISISTDLKNVIQDASNNGTDKINFSQKIKETLKSSIKSNRLSDEELLSEYYHEKQFVAIKYLIDAIGTIPENFETINNVLNKLEKYDKLKNEVLKAKKRQLKLLKNPKYRYQTRAVINSGITNNEELSDFERIEKLRYLDLSEQEEVIYPENDIHRSDYYYFSYRKAIILKSENNEIYTPKSERDISNQVRDELGVTRIGEGWKNETFLFRIISELLSISKIEVIHHYRPSFLEGQELDIYFEYDGLKVGIEYQGVQHFEPIEFFGGQKNFHLTIERDKRKLKKCIDNKIVLIYFNYWETITQNFVVSRLIEHNIVINN